MATVAKAIENNSLCDVRIRPRLIKKPIPAHSVVIDARAAVLAFLGEVADVTDYDFIPFKDWHQSYREIRAKKGWPALTEKSLSQTMQVIGCDRRQLDARGRGKGRFIAFRVPESLGMAA